MIPHPKKPEINHRTIKLLIGLVALTLPILVSVFSSKSLDSISASYYETGPSQSIFIGFLFAIAAFLTAYNGKKQPEEAIISRFAAIFALGVALFPCDCDGHKVKVPYVHFISAAILFLILARFCRIFYIRAKEKHFKQADHRAWVYLVSGITIIASIVLLAINFLLDDKIGKFFHTTRFVFFGEWAGLWAFGVSWLTASRVVPLLSQEQERRDYRSGKD